MYKVFHFYEISMIIYREHKKLHFIFLSQICLRKFDVKFFEYQEHCLFRFVLRFHILVVID